MKTYFVIRLVNKADGTVACPVVACETEIEAEKEFYRLCGVAVDSTNITDTVILSDIEGYPLEKKYFEH